MGMGEPFDNYEALLRFLTLITDEKGHHLSRRQITVSTCGIVPKIRAFADADTGVTLALSLHASNDAMRREIMPVAAAYDLKSVVDACRYYFEKTGRRVTFEYALIGGVNDTDWAVSELSALFKGFPCHLNVIPVNPVTETGMKAPDREGVERFLKALEKAGIHATVRREMGRDIDGACGQLRGRVTHQIP